MNSLEQVFTLFDLTKTQQDKLTNFKSMLLKYNKAINLISKSSVDQIDDVHFFDCLKFCSTIAPYFKESKLVYDLGSGNGFPGIIFSIYMGSIYPSIQVKMIEIDRRKTEFLKDCIFDLKLSNIEACCMDVNDLKDVSHVVTRGFDSIDSMHKKYRTIFSTEAKIYHMKSSAWESEVVESVNYSVSKLSDYSLLNDTGRLRTVILSVVTNA